MIHMFKEDSLKESFNKAIVKTLNSLAVFIADGNWIFTAAKTTLIEEELYRQTYTINNLVNKDYLTVVFYHRKYRIHLISKMNGVYHGAIYKEVSSFLKDLASLIK